MSKKTQRQRRRARQRAIATLSGQGDYFSDKVLPFLKKNVPDGTFSKAGAFLGGKAGGLAGNYINESKSGSRVGSSLGAKLGRGISSILGFGDYSVVSNSLFKEGMAIPPGEAVPTFGVLGHATKIRHREYVGDILVPGVPTAYTNTSYRINPGNPDLFPWLATVAASYQQYRFDGLVLEFKTLSSDITAGGALGSVILATNYDVLDAPYEDKIHMENSQYAVSAKPSVSQIHTIECEPMASTQNLWYIRDAASSSVGDDRFYDLGKFQLATQGLPGSAGAVLGELWATYDVSLYKPEIVATQTEGTKISVSAGVTKNKIFGTNPTSLGDLATVTGDNQITFSRGGEYLVRLILAGTGASSVNLAVSGVSATSVDVITDATLIGQERAWAVDSATGGTMTWDANAWLTVSNCTVRVTKYTQSFG
jgi:hypothetical protein